MGVYEYKLLLAYIIAWRQVVLPSYYCMILTFSSVQEGVSCPLTGAVSLCNPFNLTIADEDFHKGFNNVYDSALAGSLRKIFKK